jgi:hypothetical protein
MGRKPKQPKPGEWKHQVEDLTAYEREERGLAIYTRVLVRGKYRGKQRLCDPIRDADGRIIPEREAEAIQLAVDRQKRRAAGLSDPKRDGPLTLAAGARRMLHELEGKYAGNTTRKRDVERHLDVAIDILDGEETLVTQLRHGHYRKLWRALAHAHAKDPKKYGPEAAVKIVGALRTMVAWLQEEELIEAGTCLPSPTWKSSMREEWVQITSKPIAPPRKERYTGREQTKLWFAMPAADPRVLAAVEIGAELRLGQVLRSRRSDVLPFGGFAIGRVRVHGAGRKAGSEPILTMQARHALTRAMTSGYLAELEAAYRRGEIDDYYLLPGGKLRTVKDRRGRKARRAAVRNAGRPWGRTALRRAWWKLEELAGVEHRRWRKWYGLRRIGSDTGEDVESDERVLNDLGGWTDSATRRKYQEKGRTDVAEKVRRVRERIRPNTRRSSELQRSTDTGET